MKKIKSKDKGITLIALVITIVVLIILAGVAISLTLGDNGIFKVATKAEENTLLAQNEESVQISEATNYINGVMGTRDTVTIDKSQYDSIINRLNTLENKTNNGLIKLGTLTGTGTETSNNLDIPECTELVISIDARNNKNVILNINIQYQELTNEPAYYRTGYYISSSNNAGMVISASNKKIAIDSVYLNGTNMTSTAKMTVYYR